MRQHTGRSLIVSLAIAATTASLGAQAKPAAQAPAADHACSLLTKAEVEKYITRGRTMESDPAEIGANCSYGAGWGSVFVYNGTNAEESFGRMLKSFKGDKAPRTPLAALGPGGWVIYPKPENQYQSIGACAHGAVGQHVVFVCIESDDGKPVESATPYAEAVTKLVMAKLR